MSARTKAGVIGWPVAHSLSPALHQFWLKAHGIDGRYDAYPVEPERLESFIGGLASEGFVGVNSTLPHKERIAGLVDRLTPTAKAVGAVNTIIVEDDGMLTGDSTDGFGFVANLRSEAPELILQGARVLVLGAGGAALSILQALGEAGANLTVSNRTQARAEDLAAHMPGVSVLQWDARSMALGDMDVLINTTSLGMDGQPALEMALDDMPPGGVVADCVYAPLETKLLAAARARSLTPVDGLGMLIHQARPAFKAWFGVDPHVTPELRAHLIAAQRSMTS